MRRTFFSTIVLAVLLTAVSFGQFTSNMNPRTRNLDYTYEIYFAGTLDTAAATYDSLASQPFEMPAFNSEEYLQVNYLFTSSTGSPKILADLYGSDDATNWTRVEQVIDTTTGETYTLQQTNLSNARTKYYKLIVEQVALGRDNSTFKIWLSAKKD